MSYCVKAAAHREAVRALQPGHRVFDAAALSALRDCGAGRWRRARQCGADGREVEREALLVGDARR